MPSSRAQTWATAGAFWSVSAKAGCTAAARSTNRRTASHCASASGGGRAPRRRSGQGQRGHPPGRLPGDAQRLPAGGQDARRAGQARSRASASRAQASSRCSQLSSTSSRRLGRSASVERGQQRPARLLPHAHAPGHRLGHQGRVGQRRQLHQPHPVRVRLQGVGRGLQGQAGLARPPGAGQRHQPVGAQQAPPPPPAPAPARRSWSAAGAGCGAARPGCAGAGSRRGAPGRRAGTPAPGAGRSLQPVLPQVAQPRPRRQGVPHQGRRGLGEHHLPPVGRGRQPGAAVQRAPRSSGPPGAPPPRVQPHPRPERAPPRPRPPAAGPAAPPGRRPTASVGRAKAA